MSEMEKAKRLLQERIDGVKLMVGYIEKNQAAEVGDIEPASGRDSYFFRSGQLVAFHEAYRTVFGEHYGRSMSKDQAIEHDRSVEVQELPPLPYICAKCRVQQLVLSECASCGEDAVIPNRAYCTHYCPIDHAQAAGYFE